MMKTNSKQSILLYKSGSSYKNVICNVSMLPTDLNQRFKKGGSIALYEEEVTAKKGFLQVLDDTGKVLMNIKGGERIFSIPHTEQLVAMAKKVDRGDASPEQLGALMAKIIHIQDTQEPEFV
jgi:hypothetical protein